MKAQTVSAAGHGVHVSCPKFFVSRAFSST